MTLSETETETDFILESFVTAAFDESFVNIFNYFWRSNCCYYENALAIVFEVSLAIILVPSATTCNFKTAVILENFPVAAYENSFWIRFLKLICCYFEKHCRCYLKRGWKCSYFVKFCNYCLRRYTFDDLQPLS